MIRAATLADVEGIKTLLLAMKRHTEFATVKIEPVRALKTVRQCISSPQGFCAVAEHDGELTGVILAVKQALWYSTQPFASDLALYSRYPGEGAQLMQAMLDWADAAGCIVIAGQSSGQAVSRTQRWYESLGFTHVGGVYVRERALESYRLGVA